MIPTFSPLICVFGHGFPKGVCTSSYRVSVRPRSAIAARNKREEELAEYCRRKGLYVEQIMRWREAVYEAARQRNPRRWSGKTRNWNPVTEVWLNPPTEVQTGQQRNSKAA